MTRDDFIFTVGYQGNRAVIDKTLKRRYSGKSAQALLQEGLYRQAFCAALYDSGNQQGGEGMAPVLAELSQRFHRELDVESAKRLFGVHRIPEEIQKVLVL